MPPSRSSASVLNTMISINLRTRRRSDCSGKAGRRRPTTFWSRKAKFARRQVSVPPQGLVGELCVPMRPRGIVLFAHGSGSSRLSPRNIAVADRLNAAGSATLLFDLLTPPEAYHRRNDFDVSFSRRALSRRSSTSAASPTADLPLGLFGASTGAAALLIAAAELADRLAAIVSRGGRPDMAGRRLSRVISPTLLIVGGNDRHVLKLNQKALASLTCEKLLKVVSGAGHVFEKPGALETVTELAGAWLQHYLVPNAATPFPASPSSLRPPRCRTIRFFKRFARRWSHCPPSMILPLRSLSIAMARAGSSCSGRHRTVRLNSIVPARPSRAG